MVRARRFLREKSSRRLELEKRNEPEEKDNLFCNPQERGEGKNGQGLSLTRKKTMRISRRGEG